MGKQPTLFDVDSFQLLRWQQKVEISNLCQISQVKLQEHHYFEAKHWQLDFVRILIPQKEILATFTNRNSAFHHFCIVNTTYVKSNDVSTKFNIHQSAFCVDFFDAEMKTPETSLQALSSSPLPHPTPKRACSQARFGFVCR